MSQFNAQTKFDRQAMLDQAKELGVRSKLDQDKLIFKRRNPNASPEAQAIYEANLERKALLDSAANYGTGQGSASAKVADMMARERTAANDYRRNLTGATRGSEIAAAGQVGLDSAALQDARARELAAMDIKNAGNQIQNRYNEQEIPIRQAAAGGALELNKARVGDIVEGTGIRRRESDENILTSQTGRDIAYDENMMRQASENIRRKLMEQGGNESIAMQQAQRDRYSQSTPLVLREGEARITGMGEQNRAMTIGNDAQVAMNAAIPDRVIAENRFNQRAAAQQEMYAQGFRNEPSTLPPDELLGRQQLKLGDQRLSIEQREADAAAAEAEEKLLLRRGMRPLTIDSARIGNDKAQSEADFAAYMAQSAPAKAAREARIYGDGPRPEEYRQMLEQQAAGAEYAGIDEGFTSALSDALSIIGSSTSGTTRGGLTGTGTFGNTENLLGAIRDASMLVDRLEGPNVDRSVAAREAEKALRGLPLTRDSGEYVGVPPLAGSVLTLGANAALRAGDRAEAAKQLTELSNRLKKIASRQAPRRREIPPARGE
jgi:hypothetical protein